MLLRQTLIGQEATSQMALLGEFPDWLLACTGAKVCSLGSTCVPPSVYAGGLRHHSAGPLASAKELR